LCRSPAAIGHDDGPGGNNTVFSGGLQLRSPAAYTAMNKQTNNDKNYKQVLMLSSPGQQPKILPSPLPSLKLHSSIPGTNNSITIQMSQLPVSRFHFEEPLGCLGTIFILCLPLTTWSLKTIKGQPALQHHEGRQWLGLGP
jgi:hypothetical protein